MEHCKFCPALEVTIVGKRKMDVSLLVYNLDNHLCQ